MDTSASITTGQNGIPLHCIICTRKPTFSDVSHLLTHISSKQHLSNYFRTKVKAIGDSNAKHSLDQFDEWYENWNIDDLLRDRMQQKDSKKRRTNGNRETSEPATPPQSRSRSQPDFHNGTAPSITVDPNLDPLIKIESVARPSFLSTVMSYDEAYAPQPMMGPGHLWTINDDGLLHIKVEPDDYQPGVEVSSRLAPAPPTQSLIEPKTGRRRVSDALFGTTSSSVQSTTYTDDYKEDDTTGSVKLKGIVWPGMDLFDSATPEMQKKRNQRKTVDVVIQLEAASKTIHPDEVIFSMDGDYLKTREINGNPEHDDSSLPGETTPEPDNPPAKPKRRGRAPRAHAALAEIDVNGGVKQRRARRKNAVNRQSHSLDQVESEELDNPLAFAVNRKRKRAGFKIHRDNSGPDITFEQPAPLTYLTASFPRLGPHGTHDLTTRASNMLDVTNTPFLLDKSFRNGFKHRYADFASGQENGNHNQRDLSAFGQLTNVYNPASAFGAFNLHAIGSNTSLYASSMPDPVRFQHHPVQDTVTLTQPYPILAVPTQESLGQYAQDSFESSMDGFELRPPALNPLYTGNNRAFSEDSEHGSQHIKTELDAESNADTISLASDEK